jgi:hemerythrin-like domain-containing protein
MLRCSGVAKAEIVRQSNHLLARPVRVFLNGKGFVMNLRILMQAGPTKANELFAKLAETSDGAVKTREKLFAELKTELELHASLEEQHLFPVLRRNPETKELVGEAIKDNKDLRAKLAELEALPKNDEAFPERLKDLQKAFRQHARDEKRELLPAVQRALSEDQLQSVTEKMEAGVAEAERARHDEMQARRSAARQEREQAERSAEQAKSTVQQASEDARRSMSEAAHVAEDTATAAGSNVVKITEIASTSAQRAIADTTESVTSELKQTAELPKMAAEVVADVRSTWMDCLGQATLLGTQISQKIFWETAERQQQLAADTIWSWMDRNARLMRLAMNCAEQGFRPFGGRLSADLHERTDHRR